MVQVCTSPELLQEELQHLRKALVRCKYPHWAINKVQSKILNSNQEDSSNNNLHPTSNNTNNSMEQQTQTGDNNQGQANSIQVQVQDQQPLQEPIPPWDM